MLQFVNPLMLVGAAAAAAPIIIHLLNRRRFRIESWAAMEFLLASNRKNFRRVRLQEIILLIIRTLVLLLVAAALARPFLAGVASMLGISQRYVILIVDNSFSMGYELGNDRPHDRSIKFAERILDTLNKGDVVSLIAVSDRARPLIREASVDLEIVRSEIRGIKLSQGSTNLPDAFRQTLDLLKNSKIAQKEVYLVTDCQRAAWRIGKGEELAGVLRDVSGAASFILIDVGPGSNENVAVTEFGSADRIIGKEKPDTTFVAEIRNYGEADQQAVEVSFFVDGFRQGGRTVQVPADGAARVPFSYTFHDAVPHYLGVQLKKDRLALDDARHLAVDVVEAARVLLVDGEPAADIYRSSTGYLQTALHPRSNDAFRSSTIYQPIVIQPAELARQEFDQYEFVVLAGVPQVDAGVAADLEAYVADGGAAIIFPGNKVDEHNYNQVLYHDGMGLLPAKLAGVRGDPKKETVISLAVPPDSTHPLLKEFRRRRAAYLNTLQFYQHALLEVPKRDNTIVVFSFDNGHAALVEKKIGKGTVLMFAFTANDAWADLPRRPGFLFLVQEMAAYLARDRQKGRNLLVGDTMIKALGPDALLSKITVAGPRETFDVAATPEGRRARLIFDNTGLAGVYELRTQRGAAQQQDLFAVNVDPAESDLRRIGPQQLRRAFPEFRFRHLTGTAGLEGSLTDGLKKSDLWKRLLMAALVLMCIESILAQRFGR
jgi:hypothetical protein